MLLKDKKCLIFGVANNRSIAYGIASCFKEQGARLAFSYAGEAIHKRVEPISEELGGEFIFPCDVTSDEDIAAAAALVKEKWGGVDVLVHSVAFANREDLTKRFIETSRDGFRHGPERLGLFPDRALPCLRAHVEPRRVRAHHDLLRRSENHHQLQRDGRRQSGP